MNNIEKTLKIFDSCWFEMEIFKKQTDSSNPSTLDANPDEENIEYTSEGENINPKTITPILLPLQRSISDDLSSRTSSASISLSPDTVLFSPKLKTIHSNKEMEEKEEEEPKHRFQVRKVKNMGRRKKGLSKSLSELEFDELKGFVDLGFVFPEEETDSRLVGLIPALERLVRRKDGEEKQGNTMDESGISRPYLSEAWDQEVLEKNHGLVDWRFLDSRDEMRLKDNLRLWAHTVASTVKR